jgi:hypothetical protein
MQQLSLERVLAFREAMFKSSVDIIARKGADYNRDQQQNGDTLFNLRVAEVLGIVPSAEEGILVRLSDKFMRLISLTKPGREAAVKDESVLDTIRDIHNYVDYLGLIWQERRQATTLKVGIQDGFERLDRAILYQKKKTPVDMDSSKASAPSPAPYVASPLD